MMKKFLVILAVLVMATVADAGLTINVNDAMETVTIIGDGATASPAEVYLLVEGPGSIDGGSMVYPGSLAEYSDLEAVAANIGMSTDDTLTAFRGQLSKPDLVDLSFITLADGAIPPALLDGTLVDGIGLIGTGSVVLSLVSSDFATVFDTTTVPIPEPITIALLSIGGLLLRRRR